MRFNYVDYRENLFEKVVESNKPKVYVFDNYNNLQKARGYYNSSFLQKESIFITMQDLKEKLFPTDRLILKEEKLTIIFYELLTEDEKRELNIKSYFDVIDLSAEFFKFYNELNEYCIDRLEGLRDWQEEKYLFFEKIRARYINRMKELSFTDSTLIFDFNNFSIEYLMGYEDMVFVNLIDFTPKEKQLIRHLEEAGIGIELYLQLFPGDFNEKELKLNSVTLPATPDFQVEIYYTEEDLYQITNLISLLEGGEDYTILDADFKRSIYHRLFSPEKIFIDKSISFTETRLYRFIETLNKLYATSDISDGVLKLEIGELLSALYLPEFRKYYGFKIKDIKQLLDIAKRGFVYFSPEMEEYISCELGSYERIFDDIKSISQITDLNELSNFLEGINLEILDDKWLKNNITRYFDALLELSTIEDLNIVSSWDKYFANRSQGLLQLALNYFRFKEVDLARRESPGVELKDLFTASYSSYNNLIILNAMKGVIPSETGNNFLLTEKQRAEMGLKTTAERKVEEKYYFYRHIFNSNKTVIFSLKNLEGDITTSSFVDELSLEYGINLKELKIGPRYLTRIIGDIFPSNSGLGKKINAGLIQQDKLMIEPTDFSGGEFSLGYYKYKTMKDCYYKFYLEQVMKLEEDRVEVKYEVEPKIFGTLIHEIFARVITRTGKKVDIDEEVIKEVVDRVFKSNYLKIHNYYKKYYQEIILPRIKESVSTFFNKLGRKISEEIEEIKIEWQPVHKGERIYFQNEISSFYLNGRIDLVIETIRKKYIIDFKTGGFNMDQLDFYSLLLAPGHGKDFEIEKSFYLVLDGRFVPGYQRSEEVFFTKIKEDIKELFELREYKRELKSICKWCNYSEVCRVVKG